MMIHTEPIGSSRPGAASRGWCGAGLVLVSAMLKEAA
jgi:hypothetical protein